MLDEWANTSIDLPTSGRPPVVVISPGQRAREIGNALLTLAEFTPEMLENRLVETLGLAMHRLDAWITAYAEQHAGSLRDKTPFGIQIGGYGWVENLRPDPANESPTQGYIHSPSMTHAAMAAVLRSGYSAFSDGTATSPMSVDLRSDRVRVASWMMDGVRQGQRINDLLGYRFERYLHDHQLDIWIQPMRDVVAAEGTTELAGTTDLVTLDGLALLELWDEGNGALDTLVDPPLDQQGKPHAFDQVVLALEYLVWITDSMADLALAESVHAILQGDYERASAVQSAAALGDIPPPELRSIRTPNSGATVTHRLMLVPQGSSSDWAHETSVRSQLEPGLEAWVANLLGAPERILYRVYGGANDPVEVRTLADLALSALDAIYLAPAGGQVAGSALYALIAHDYRQRYGKPMYPIPSVTVDADVPVADDHMTINEFNLLASSLRRMLGDARPATQDDFLSGTSEAQAGDAETLMGRALGLLNNFGAAIKRLDDGKTPRTIALLNLAHYNLPQAIPSTIDNQMLTEQADSVRSAAIKRTEQVQKAIQKLQMGDISPEKQLKTARNIFAIIMGRDFPIMSPFALPADTAPILPETDVASVPGDSTPAMGWLLKMTRVRPKLGIVRDAIAAAEMLHDRSLFPFWVSQSPHHPDDIWVGVGRPKEDASDRLSLVLTSNDSLTNVTGEWRALVLDQWTERIPTDYEMTGLTFHYDAPTSRPPQVLLLAMPPAGETWDFDVALDTLREAFARARLRAIAPETLGDYGHQVPAVYLSNTLDTTGASDAV